VKIQREFFFIGQCHRGRSSGRNWVAMEGLRMRRERVKLSRADAI